jgi:hypothetical protein
LTYSSSLGDTEGNGSISTVSFSNDNQKCLVGYENGAIMLFDTNGWKALITKNMKPFEIPVVAADWTLDNRYLVVENVERKAAWYEFKDKSIISLPGPDIRRLNQLMWRSGEIYSSWQVFIRNLDNRFPKADQFGAV